MFKAGDRAPEFTLPDDTGKDRSLTEFLNVGATVLYFYPADFTPGCTRQACILRDMQTEIQNAGLRVVGISPQDPQSHTKFRTKYNLPFTLLSDERQDGHQDVWASMDRWGSGCAAPHILIDGSRRIRDVVLADFRIGRHREFVQKAILLRATLP